MKKSLMSGAAGIALAISMSASSLAQDVTSQPDGTWISISGTIESAAPDSFVLDYEGGTITVEMDDWDWYQEGTALKEDDKVTVYGRIDDDIFETRTIEAGSVYVENLNTYFYANDADEEDQALAFVTTPIVVAWMDLVGTVDEVNGREFILDTGNRQIQVDTSSMAYNPMDDEGFQKIDEGDRVKVSGNMDYDLFERKEVMANSIITLEKDKSKTTN